LSFAKHAGDLYASNALERFGNVGVGQLADVLGGDDIDNLIGVAFDLCGPGERSANAGDDDFSSPWAGAGVV
jgi:hypothetical protein